jgi:class 3 adenylate cyclase
MMFVTLFALFGSDIKLVAFDSGADATFDSLNLICFWLFFIELALNAWAKSEFGKDGRLVQGYFGSFFFWLDLLALWSITLEVPSLAESTGQGQLVSADSSDHAEGFKAGRVVRMIRLVRLVKLYKITSQRRQEKKMLEDLEVLIEQGRMEEEEIEKFKMNMNHQKQSKVGTDLVDTITRKVIMMILSMLLMVPYLTFEETPRHFEVSTSLLNNVIKNDPADCLTINPAVQHMIKATNRMGRDVPSEYHEFELLDLVVDPDQCNITDTVFDALRAAQGTDGASYTGFVDGSVRKDFVYPFCAEEKCPVEGDEDRICTTCTKFDVSKDAMEGAKQSIFLTLFVIVILISMSIAFENDAQTLILTPIEQMMSMINMVADDPLEEFDFADMVGSSTQYELKVVVLAIQKITTLLRIGFGEAGAEIISKNMSVEGGSSQGLDPMIPGKRMYAIFGFCDIHEFDMCTEVLEDEIMTFVNSVARIVHDQVTRWGGTCNKNLGNAFLMIWRIGDEEDLIDNNARKRIQSQQSDGETVHHASVNLKRIPGLDDLSDKALLGFLKVVVEINRDKQVLAYRNDKRLQHEGHDFKLRMGFGLHAGWGIEGAVGSLQKVDATYLSPHVNMSARMEAASRQFGVAVLMTESFFELMSNEAQSVCRRLDIVTVKGSAQPMPIYTYDTFQNQEFPELLAPKNTDLSLASLLKKQADNYTTREWTTDRDLLQLRGLATPAFNEKFKEGINAYLAANWAKARQLLEECDKMMEKSDRGGDGPSQTILGYMRNRAWQCPPEWQGYRPLTSK